MLLVTLCVSEIVFAADNNNFPALLSELEVTVAEFVEVDARGQELQATRASNRREMGRLDAEASAIAGLKAQIDSRVAEYTSALATFGSECEGQRLTGTEAGNCRSQQQALLAMSASLEEDAAQLSPRVSAYNQQIDTFNAQDAQLAAQEENLFEQTREYINQIDDLKGRFDSIANVNGDAGMITAVQRCNALEGFKDTLTCLRAVWRLYSR